MTTNAERPSELSPEDARHGSVNGYSNLDCRCDQCREAWRIEGIRRRKARSETVTTGHPLGRTFSQTTYTNWGCRCQGCRAAHLASKKGLTTASAGSSTPEGT